MKLIAAALLFWLTLPAAHAAPEGGGSKSGKAWRAVFELGPTVAAGSSFTLTPAGGGATLLNDTTSDPLGYALAGELDRQYGMFGVGIAIDYMRYVNANAPNAPDRELSLMFVPRVEGPVGSLVLWGGFAFGLTHTSIGAGKNISPDWLGASGGPTSFVWSPRFGADYALGQWVVGGKLAYMSTAGSSTAEQPASPTLAFSRHWIEIAAVVGLRY